MKIVEKNVGPKIDHSITGTKLNLNDEMILDLARYERDFDVHIDICENWAGMLTMGIADKYVAQIDIPARRYKKVPVENTGDVGTENEEESMILESVPFSMENVTLTLWSTEGGNK